jgi:hypothetical protein
VAVADCIDGLLVSMGALRSSIDALSGDADCAGMLK